MKLSFVFCWALADLWIGFEWLKAKKCHFRSWPSSECGLGVHFWRKEQNHAQLVIAVSGGARNIFLHFIIFQAFVVSMLSPYRSITVSRAQIGLFPNVRVAQTVHE